MYRSVLTGSMLVVGCLGLVLGACASTHREQADIRMPVDGPLGEARRLEAEAAFGNGAPQAGGERPLPQPLSIVVCIDWALEHNRDLRLQVSSAERSRESTTVARSEAYAPKLTATASRELTKSVTGSQRDDATSARVALSTNLIGFTVAPYLEESWSATDSEGGTTPYTHRVGVSVSRRLFALAEWTRLDQALTQADRAYATAVNSLTLRSRRLALEVATAFLELQRAQTRMQLRERRVAEAATFLDGVRESVLAGLKAPIEEANALIARNQAEADLLGDRLAVANASDAVLSLLDRPLGIQLEILPARVDDIHPDMPVVAEDIALVRTAHEEILNQRIDIEYRRDNERMQRDALAPQLTATIGAERRWESAAPLARTNPEDVLSLSLDLELPIDGWAGARAGLRQTERLLRESRLRLRAKEVELELDVRQLRRRIDRQVTAVDLASQRLKAEQDKYAATEASYQTGRVDNLELTRARTSLDQAEVSLLESRIDLVLLLAERDALLPRPIQAEP